MKFHCDRCGKKIFKIEHESTNHEVSIRLTDFPENIEMYWEAYPVQHVHMARCEGCAKYWVHWDSLEDLKQEMVKAGVLI